MCLAVGQILAAVPEKFGKSIIYTKAVTLTEEEKIIIHFLSFRIWFPVFILHPSVFSFMF